MMETWKLYERGDVQIEVVSDDDTDTPVYLGVFTPAEAHEVSIDRRDLRAVCRMLGSCIRPDDPH